MPNIMLEKILSEHLDRLKDVPVLLRNSPTSFAHKARITMTDGSDVIGYVLGLHRGKIRLSGDNSVLYGEQTTSVILLPDMSFGNAEFVDPDAIQLDRIARYEVLESCPKRAAVKLNGKERLEVVRPRIQTSPYGQRYAVGTR